MEMKRGQRLNIMELIIETQSESLLTALLNRFIPVHLYPAIQLRMSVLNLVE